MKSQLVTLIEQTNPKQLSAAVKKHSELYKWVETFNGATTAEKIYNVLNPGNNICQTGNNKKFISLTQGYKFCGKASVCSCAKESISKSVSDAKLGYSLDRKKQIQQQRESTNRSRYGVMNSGQTVAAKESRAAVYTDNGIVQSITARIKETKQQRYGDPNFNNPDKIKQTFKEKYPTDYWCEKYDNQNLKILADKDLLTELYKRHSTIELATMLDVHVQTVYRYLNLHNLREPFKSSEETEVVRFLESIGVTNIIRNTRSLLPSRREIDIYLPDLRIAIEYNGVYWHHEDVSHITKDYHSSKFEECDRLGIQLITIFSNFWKFKTEIVKQVLLNKLGMVRESVYARKCSVVQVSTKDAREFLNTHHIQGYTTSSYNYGLQLNDKLVAIMTFGKTRMGIGKQEDGHELIRFASSCRVAGGASKLLSHFIKTHRPTKIISYSDNEWSLGQLYKSLGFVLENKIKASYWYLKPKEERLMHRFNFSKQKLVKLGYNSSLTEREITKQMGLLKIWDCGKRRWVLELDNLSNSTD